MAPGTCLSKQSAAHTTTASPSPSRRHVSGWVIPIRTCKGGGHLDNKVGGLLAIPYRQMPRSGRVTPLCVCTKALPCSHAANQLVSMHDLKQGLGPSGTDGPRKLTYNKYKLKVSALRFQLYKIYSWYLILRTLGSCV